MKKSKVMMLVLFLVSLLSGCTMSEKPDDSAYHQYYLNKEETRIVEEAYAPKADDADGMIQEFIDLLEQESDDVQYLRVLQNGIRITDYTLDGGQLSLVFNDAYSKMNVAKEVLCRAAVVRMMIQIPEVSCVSFYIGDLPLSDSRGNVVGLMTDESFVENPGEQINAIQTATIHLYFSNETGDGLVEVLKEVQYSSNISMEKLVMEHLLEGPQEKDLLSAIPDGTKLVSVSTTNGVCYVNLDEGFLNQKYEVQEPIVIYSIVDSLSEITNVNKVQISVNGDSKEMYRDSFSLDTLYERNLDYVVTKKGEESATEESETVIE